MDDQTRARLLIGILADRLRSVAERDDAAMDLADYDGLDVQRALMACACNADEEPLLQASAGQALAEIWVRTGVFLADRLALLAPPARAEAEAVIRKERPSWLQ